MVSSVLPYVGNYVSLNLYLRASAEEAEMAEKVPYGMNKNILGNSTLLYQI
jgi:hypothetical protein